MPVALVGLLFLVLVAADDRLTASTELLQSLEDANVFHAKVAIGETAYGGIGVFAAEDIAAGSVIMRLPSSLMVNSGGIPASLPLALLREQRNASSEIMRYYLDSLPADCPDNLAASLNVNADHALVSASLHAWKADLLERELQVLRDDDADWTDALCSHEHSLSVKMTANIILEWRQGNQLLSVNCPTGQSNGVLGMLD